MRAAALAVPMVLAAATASPQTRPLETEEATTAPAGTVFLEAGVAGMGEEPNYETGARRSRWDVPVLRLVLSPAANVELDVEWTSRVVAVDDPDFGTVSDWSDVALRTKWRFAAERGARPAFAARVAVMLPQTSFEYGLGPDTLRASLQLLVTRTWDGTALHLNAGIAVQDKPTELHAQADFLAYGVALAQRLGGPWELVAEVAGLGVGRAGEPGADRRGEARLGIRRGQQRLRFDLALRRGFEAADGTWGLTAGLAWRLRRPAVQSPGRGSRSAARNGWPQRGVSVR
jgi:hypothetical protein